MKEENKEIKKKKNFFKSKTFLFAVLPILVMMVVSAGFVSYYSQKQIHMEFESGVTLQGELSEDVGLLMAGDGYNIYLVEGENKLNESVDVEFQFTLLKDGIELEDTEGFYLAYSDDIQYAYSEEYGNVDNWEDAKDWLYANLDWFDWYLTGDLGDYDDSIITNHGGNSAYENVLDFNTAIAEDLDTGKFYAVVYFDSSVAIVPDNYTLRIDMMPTA